MPPFGTGFRQISERRSKRSSKRRWDESSFMTGSEVVVDGGFLSA
jgi:hypothetical protein